MVFVPSISPELRARIKGARLEIGDARGRLVELTPEAWFGLVRLVEESNDPMFTLSEPEPTHNVCPMCKCEGDVEDDDPTDPAATEPTRSPWT